VLQPVLAAMVLSLLLAPLIVHFSDRLVFRFVASEWLLRSMQLTQTRGAVADARTSMPSSAAMAAPASIWRASSKPRAFPSWRSTSIPERVREASMAGEAVSYGDSRKRKPCWPQACRAPAW
jgi:CPA2 family monovalent cation:H+ antiporter-2